ncbi:hypothetical protein [Arsenophonus nasoniae]|uniref:Uncharacterized protein n=1 Tax=Arsenophonus nasoniae TaxID=638 RepID=A0ABY8NWZ8_9GAMM|nr:hypothetical protein [Arsenophonus nasoniae]WGM08105.1 hypothetical protein QE258_21475 [Arsenophonus nasoniae]
MYPNFTVTELCHLFEVSSSSFYYETKIPTVENERLCGEIKRIFYTSGQIYGKRRIERSTLRVSGAAVLLRGC